MPRADRIAAAVAASAALAGLAAGEVVTCAGAGTMIPEGPGSAAVVVTTTPDPGSVVSGVRVGVTLDHSWLGDLTVTVERGGRSAVLIDRVASGVWSFGCGGSGIDAVFADGAATAPESLCVPGGPTPMLVGDLSPVEALSVFDGLPVGGDWTITIADGAAFDGGSVGQVCVSFVALTPCVGDLTGDGSTLLDDFAVFASNFGQSVPPGTGGDFDGDGEVLLNDFAAFAADFGCEPGGAP